MAGILSFSQYLGGPDNVQVEQIFPSNQRTLVYSFKDSAGLALNLTGWTFSADYQTIVIDQVQFNRNTGQPNFSNSTVIGSFAKVEITGDLAPSIISASGGTVKVNFPAGMYTGPIIPDARQNVPMTIFSLTWSDASTPPQINTHRWCLIQSWEPDVVVGDPTLDPGFTALTVGA
jgi:hypothetical protein